MSRDITLAVEVARRYSNFVIPPPTLLKPDAEPAPTLEDQSNGKSVLQPSTDVVRLAGGTRRLTIDKVAQIIQLYRAGSSLDAIGVGWNTAARVLAEAGLRPRH